MQSKSKQESNVDKIMKFWENYQNGKPMLKPKVKKKTLNPIKVGKGNADGKIINKEFRERQNRSSFML